jgi:hypothetical protein
MWSPAAIADTIAEVLRARDAALREEQAVYGLDANLETALHPIIAEGLAAHGYGVLREQPYPHEWVRKLKPAKTGLDLPIPRERMRCDIVLTPEPGQTLDDSLVNEKQRRKEVAELEGTLFESLTASHLAPGAPASELGTRHSALSTCPPESAFWLELKSVGQFCNTSGLPGPNRTYTSEITRNPIADLKKLSEDHRIHHAGAALIVFTEGEATAKHDLAILAHRCLDKHIPLPLGGPILRTFPIPDRIGNAACTVCLLALAKE